MQLPAVTKRILKLLIKAIYSLMEISHAIIDAKWLETK